MAQLTGYRYLSGFSSDEEQYAALMNAGATFAKDYGLVPGVALTAAQMAQLTSDIVWLVEQSVTLPDGSTQRVLAPQVYVRVRPGDIDGSGALLSAERLNIDGKTNNLINTGVLAGRQVVDIKAASIDNLGGRISGGSVALAAEVDINNLGGSIDARERLSLQAGRDINIVTTVAQGTAGNSVIDRVAGLYVCNPGGLLTVSAGRDANLFGATVRNDGAGSLTAITAKNDINLGTVQTSSQMSAASSSAQISASATQELGTTLSTNGTVALNATRDVNLRQANVGATGLLSVQAGRDLNIGDGQATNSGSYSAQ